MNFLIWNIRGIGNGPSQKHLHNFYHLHKIKILAIMEPKVQLDSMFFCRRLGFSKVTANCSNKVWCFVDADFDSEVILDHKQFLHLKIKSQLLPQPFFFTCIYAKCKSTGRRPWLLGGDFNIILHLHERTGQNQRSMTPLNEFGDMISDCGLIDAGYAGNCFTWTNHRVWKRLDRMLYSESWLDLFYNTKVTHLTRIWSDHAPLLTSVSFQAEKPPSSFRFMKIWTRHHLFSEAIVNSWWWNINIFGDIFINIRNAEQEVSLSEQRFDENPSEINLIELKRCSTRNTKFFHSLVKKKRCKNRIHSISEAGRVITDQEEIKVLAPNFFQALLTNDIPNLIHDELDCLSQIPSNFNIENLHADPTMEEIEQAVFNIDPDSVAGPDGFSALFFQHCWSIIQEDVKDAVMDFFHGNAMPRSYTATSLVLIPKSDSPTTWNDFRPISLCNVTNKIITKILSSRLENLLPRIIAPSQSGFVKGRLISDNILLAQELIHNINAKRKHDNVAFKLDMAKAYDRTQWAFLYKIMKKIGFTEKWISLVRNCIENCWFSVLINGMTAGFFKSSRGLRQGDPLSPSLFIIATEFLSRSLDSLFSKHKEMYYFNNGGLRISHLSYVDDIIIFSNCQGKVLKRLMDFLEHYSNVSGQLISQGKSSFIVNSKCPNLIIQRLRNITGFSLKYLPVIYLGAPLYKGNKKCALFQDLIGKMRSRIQGWEKSTLSHGGRLALIKSTLATMPIYLMQVTQPPKSTSWENICYPIEEGGLGIRKLSDMVKAFSFKLWWRFRSMSSLWAFYMFKRYCGCTFPGAVKVSVHDSSTWKRMCKIRKEAQDNIFGYLEKAKSHSSMITGLEMPLLRQLCSEQQLKLSSHRDFSVSSAWNFIRSNKVKRKLLGSLWCPQLTPTMTIFLWRLVHNWIPVDTQLSTPYANSSHIRTLIPLLILWFLWTERNDAKFRNKGFYSHRVIWKTYKHLYYLFKCRKLDRKLWRGDMTTAKKLEFNLCFEEPKKTLKITWRKPPLGWYKLNMDGASKGGTGQAVQEASSEITWVTFYWHIMISLEWRIAYTRRLLHLPKDSS
ncbi:hypothetical protein Pfo_015821 [Paulownia fortunei]|nr:hypothetical protein Pfo_015821 [Paulownia fortunei]